MIYIHIPFCSSFCTYCGFYSETASCHGSYVDALVREIASRRQEIAGTAAVNTLYIGGGTPSVLPLSLFERIVSAVKSAASVREFDEFTVELNPEDVVEKGESYAEALLKAGVTRASMGVQSFDDGVLRWMNRRHSAAGAVEAYRILERAGFGNISVDLIFGLPDLRASGGFSPADRSGNVPLLTEDLWRRTLHRALEISASGIPPAHISAYQLSVEPDSALERLISGGRCVEAAEDVCAGQYEILCDVLRDAGYRHYEISNFALPGREAVHNSAYWRHVPYAGFGPGAHSLRILPDGRLLRSWNLPDLGLYLKTFGADGGLHGFPDKLRGEETLTGAQAGLENVMLGLRTSHGCSAGELEAACGRERLERALASGHLVPSGGDVPASSRYRIPEKFFFISDSIISDLVV